MGYIAIDGLYSNIGFRFTFTVTCCILFGDIRADATIDAEKIILGEEYISRRFRACRLQSLHALILCAIGLVNIFLICLCISRKLKYT